MHGVQFFDDRGGRFLVGEPSRHLVGEILNNRVTVDEVRLLAWRLVEFKRAVLLQDSEAVGMYPSGYTLTVYA